MRATVNRSGNLTIPQEILKRHEINPGDELLILHTKDGILISKRDPHLQSFTKSLLKKGSKLKGDDKLIADLTAREYLSLPEEEKDRLWDELTKDAARSLRSSKEIEVGADFVPIRQRRR
jgi:bifunctional DNA-binding transcriptional regulator/antitoxin component of YhaV-PrlF toxin-antitoxin module